MSEQNESFLAKFNVPLSAVSQDTSFTSSHATNQVSASKSSSDNNVDNSFLARFDSLYVENILMILIKY
jgi:hypothetical protein